MLCSTSTAQPAVKAAVNAPAFVPRSSTPIVNSPRGKIPARSFTPDSTAAPLFHPRQTFSPPRSPQPQVQASQQNGNYNPYTNAEGSELFNPYENPNNVHRSNLFGGNGLNNQFQRQPVRDEGFVIQR